MTMHRFSLALATIFLGSGTLACGPGGDDAGVKPEEAGNTSISIQLLSRGRGVPPESGEIYRTIKERVGAKQATGVVASSEEKILGIEGERELCITLATQGDKEEFLREIDVLVGNADLLRVEQDRCETGANN